jgi:hypothetical protein
MITREQAVDIVIEIAEGGNLINFTTAVMSALGFNVDEFFPLFHQLSRESQLRALRGLADFLSLQRAVDKFGHCSQ